MGLMLYDSTFFVDLDRERRKGTTGPAHNFLKHHARDGIAISVITHGELARGFATRALWEDFCRGIEVLPLDQETLWTAARVFNTLREAGTPISDNDLWIGSTALCRGLPVVTENASHLGKIPGLKIRSHR